MISEEMKQLVEENEELKRKLRAVTYQKESLVKAIMNREDGVAEKMLIEENQKLKEEIAVLKKQLSDADRKEQVIEDLEEKLSILTKGRNWRAAVNQNIAKSMGVSAQALCYAVKGYSVKEIVEELNDEVTERTVYRALSVKNDTDLQRITTIFHQFKEVFESHNVTEDDVLEWFTKMRIRKLRLVAREDVIQCFGEKVLDRVRKDTYVQGEYYDIRRLKAHDCTSEGWGY